MRCPRPESVFISRTGPNGCPAYYFPKEDVRMELLTPNGHTQHWPSRGDEWDEQHLHE
jgi:uncharacterized protein (DUF427 family)